MVMEVLQYAWLNSGLFPVFSPDGNEGKFNSHEKEKLNFAAALGLIAEHTQGVDVKTHLRHWDAYNMDTFKAFRAAELFSKAEQSWKEIDAYIGSAITLLPPSLPKRGNRRSRESRPNLFKGHQREHYFD